VAGAPVLVGVGAPTSLAVELARDRQLTLCGFARDGHVNVYTGGERLKASLKNPEESLPSVGSRA
jgi:FdhD protein